MNLWLIIPVKSFRESKSRLMGVLSIEERAALSQRLLAHVITAARAARVCTNILVTSRAPTVLEFAQSMGARSLREEAHPVSRVGGALEQTLNRALDQARGFAVEHGAEAILILPADLPWITPDDIEHLVHLAAHAKAAAPDRAAVVIAPSHDDGTNALLLHPPAAIDFAFGRNSFLRHQEKATAVGADFQVVRRPGLAFDLDRPQELALWQNHALPKMP